MVTRVYAERYLPADENAKLQADSLTAASPLLADTRQVALTTQRQALTQQIAMLDNC